MRGSVPLIRKVPEYFIEGDNIIISVDGEPFCAFSVRDFQAGMARAKRVIAEHFERRAQVVPMRRRGHG